MKIEDLIDLQEEIAESKTKKAQLEGERNAIMKQLKEDWGCKTVKQAEALIEEKEQEVKALEVDIETGLEELEMALNQ